MFIISDALQNEFMLPCQMKRYQSGAFIMFDFYINFWHIYIYDIFIYIFF